MAGIGGYSRWWHDLRRAGAVGACQPAMTGQCQTTAGPPVTGQSQATAGPPGLLDSPPPPDLAECRAAIGPAGARSAPGRR